MEWRSKWVQRWMKWRMNKRLKILRNHAFEYMWLLNDQMKSEYMPRRHRRRFMREIGILAGMKRLNRGRDFELIRKVLDAGRYSEKHA